MKKIKMIFATFAALFSMNAFATGYPVFDVSGWLAAIDGVYQQYETVQNTITQIENQYKQIQQAVEKAKSIDWSNIHFDGDFDIRNDLKDATRRVGAVMQQTQNIKSILNAPSFSAGSFHYSIADLCGAGEEGKNAETVAKGLFGYFSENMKKTGKDLAGTLTQNERKAILRKYGIPPETILTINLTKEQMKQNTSKAIAEATAEAKQIKLQDAIARSNNIIQAALETTDSDGNPTQGGMNQANLLLTQQLIEGLTNLQNNVNDVTGLVANKINAEQAEKSEMEEAESQLQVQKDELYRTLPNNFLKIEPVQKKK